MNLQIPSPLEKIYLNEKVGEIYIKRDDLIHPDVSGNKWRKLKGLLSRFKGNQIVTYGGAFSNHLLAVASYAHHNGLTSKGIIRGKELTDRNPTLSKCVKYGMELEFIDRETYRRLTKTPISYSAKDFENHSLIIPEGGTTIYVKEGMKELVQELNDQIHSINAFQIFCSYGTGGTALGIGANLREKDYISIVPALKNFSNTDLKGQQKELKCEFDNYILNSYPEMKRYAAKDQIVFSYCEHFLEKHNILLDPIYTGKVMFYLDNYSTKNDREIIFIHTGGIQAWKGYFYRFPELKTSLKNIYAKVMEQEDAK